MSVINFAIIGFGKMGQIRLDTIVKNNLGKIIFIYDRDKEKIPQNFNFAEPRVIFESNEVDAIILCLPNFLNKEYTIKSLKAGKSVFCEKPPCLNIQEMEEISRIEKETDAILMYGFNHRHHDSIIKMQSIVRNGDLGKVLWMRGRYGKSVPKNFLDDWRSNPTKSGGGILIDQGIHMLDLMILFSGGFDIIKSDVSSLFWKSDIEDNVFAILKNSKNGIRASLHSTMTQWRHLFSFEVFLERGHLILNGLITSSKSYGEEILSVGENITEAPAVKFAEETTYRYETDSSWLNELSYFCKCIKNNTKPSIGNSNDAKNVMQVINKIYLEGRV